MKSTTIATIAAVIALTGCGATDDTTAGTTDAGSPDATTTPAAADPATTPAEAPTETAGPTPEPASETAGPLPRPLTYPELEAALLTVADLPDGWTFVPPSDSSLGSLGNRGSASLRPEHCVEFAQLIGAENEIRSTMEAEAGFELETGETSQFLGQKIHQNEFGQSPANFVESLTELVDECPEIYDADEPDGARMRLSTLEPFPRLGDDSLPLRITAGDDTLTLTLDIAVVVRNGYLISLTTGGFAADPSAGAGVPQLLPVELTDFATSAIEKFDAVADTVRNPSPEDLSADRLAGTFRTYEQAGYSICELLFNSDITVAADEIHAFRAGRGLAPADPDTMEQQLLEYCQAG